MRSDVIFLTDDNLVLYDPELAGLFKWIKKRVKKDLKIVKKTAPYVAAAAATFYGGPAAGAAVMTLAKGVKEAKQAKEAAEHQKEMEKKEQALMDEALRTAGVVPGAPKPAAETTLVQAPDGSFVLPEQLTTKAAVPMVAKTMMAPQVTTAGMTVSELMQSPLVIAAAIGGGVLLVTMLQRRRR